jgi:hypothetical protein
MLCVAVISWLLGQPVRSTRDTPGNEKHSGWLSGRLSIFPAAATFPIGAHSRYS